MTKKITIAIDGFSSTGKSTVAKQLAKELGYVYVDTGAMYRAVSLYAMNNSMITENSFDREALIEKLPSVNLKFIFDENLGFAAIYLNGENVEEQIRKMDVSNHVSKVASVSEVREKLVSLQKIMGEEKGIVMDGRDIGTVVFPNAELKLFMTASPEERAGRRFKELEGKGEKVSYDEVFKNVVDRDHMDTTREDSPLVMAEDAIEIDNSFLTVEEQFDIILSLAKEKIEE
ncbi:(d)CMP kinase [Gillisia limnaea]|uniref:Cytidylate kinase n=1 Tax=Gillisia limnaea (strain DSM 15749 / LMG 21470 / R-8282) TaxID=865937 RepID=H2BZ93_GILLR|nr:(d)CMP kinase [Gillisia limnaea]EHQ01222.1 Cytidylate kinase [Gillisia limnaea DSM 15749]